MENAPGTRKWDVSWGNINDMSNLLWCARVSLCVVLCDCAWRVCFSPICGVWVTGMVPMSSVCPVIGSWASWACAGWCRWAGSDVKPGHTTQQLSIHCQLHWMVLTLYNTPIKISYGTMWYLTLTCVNVLYLKRIKSMEAALQQVQQSLSISVTHIRNQWVIAFHISSYHSISLPTVIKKYDPNVERHHVIQLS